MNGTPMPAGATLFPGDVIRLGEASTAALRFGNSLVLAAPLTELVVESEGVSLRNGRLQVRAGGEESFAISGPFFHVNIAAFAGAYQARRRFAWAACARRFPPSPAPPI